MALYLVSYDINEKDAWEYDQLWAKLKELRATKILYSEWLIVGEVGLSATIYNKVAAMVQIKDRLIVQELTKDASWDKLLITDETFQRLLENARG